MNALTFSQIQNFNGVVPKGADEQSFPGGIEIEMIYSSLDSGQRYRSLQFDPRVTGFGGKTRGSRCCHYNGDN